MYTYYKMDTHYSLRITWPDNVNRDKFFEQFEKDSNQFCYVDEIGTKTDKGHTHFYLILLVKEATFRSHLRLALGKGNGVWSLKKLSIDPDYEFAIEYLAYMTKTGVQNLVVAGLPLKWIDDSEVYAAQVRLDMAKKVKEKKNVIQQLHSMFLEENALDSESGFYLNKLTGEIPTVQNMTKMVLRYYQKTDKLIREFQIQSQIETLLMKYDPSFSDFLSEKISKNILK